jgi:hypothetical protein
MMERHELLDYYDLRPTLANHIAEYHEHKNDAPTTNLPAGAVTVRKARASKGKESKASTANAARVVAETMRTRAAQGASAVKGSIDGAGKLAAATATATSAPTLFDGLPLAHQPSTSPRPGRRRGRSGGKKRGARGSRGGHAKRGA